MILRYFYDDALAQASYLVGCAATGEALVIDPMRDITPYVETAQKEGLRITHVTETHIHADFVSGSRELAAATKAMIYLSDMGDENWKYAFADQPNVILLRDADRFMVGNIRVDVIHTPGHTLEHLSFMITDTANANRPMGVFTGDFLFVGDVGRPDLLEEAAGWVGTKEPGARQQFATVQRFKELPDYLQIWPGHGAGSACGKALGAVPSTTLGYEKLFNPAFQFTDETSFVTWLLDGQPEAPRYFAQMKKVNKLGPTLLRDVPQAQAVSQAELDGVLQSNALIIDFRVREAFAAAHLPTSLSVPATGTNYSTYVGWFVNYDRPMYLVLPDETALASITRDLQAIGIDNIPGYLLPATLNGRSESLPMISAHELAERVHREHIMILDVRGQSEYCERHITGAKHIALGYLPQHLTEIPTDTPVVTQCASGYRSQIAASWLRAHGYSNVVNLLDGAQSWSKALNTESCPSGS